MGWFTPKKVHALITDEECEAFMKVNREADAIKEMQNGLVDRMFTVNEKRSELWKGLKEKYSLPDAVLSLDSKTKEIKDAE